LQSFPDFFRSFVAAPVPLRHVQRQARRLAFCRE
jgi:hypothetical protein